MWFFIVEKNLNESNLSFCSENTNESRIQKLVNRTGLEITAIGFVIADLVGNTKSRLK